VKHLLFPLRLASKELRRNSKFTFAFLANLTLGLVGFLTLDSFKTSVEASVHVRSKALLGADLSVSARRELSAEEENVLRETLGPGHEQSRVVEFFTMAAGSGNSRLVQIKAIEENYPFYGEPERRLSSSLSLSETTSAWVSEELLPQLNVALNDEVKIGEAKFKVADIVVQDPSASSSFLALAPKIYLGLARLERTKLIREGGSVNYTRLIRLPAAADAEAVTKLLNERMSDPGVRVQSHKAASDQVARAAKYLGDYLGLATLVAFFLASVGGAYLFQSYLSRRLKEIAVLRSLGVTSRSARAVYVSQLVSLGVLAVIPAGLGSLLLLPAITSLLQAFFPFTLTPSLSARSLFLGLLLSGVGSVALCLPALARIGRLRPSLLFQESRVSLPPSWRDSLWLIPAVIFYWVVSVWQAKSLVVGSLFVAGLLASTAAVLFFGALLLGLLGRMQWKNLVARLPLRQLARQKVATLSCFLALSTGVLLLNLIAQIQLVLRSELQEPEKSRLPAFFLFDIQDEQIDGVTDLLRKEGATLTNVSPLVRARLVAVNGESWAKDVSEGENLTREQEVEKRFRNRAFNLTYRKALNESEEIVAGQDFSSEMGAAKVSAEKEFANRMGLGIGDKLTFDVQGVPIEATIANLRRIRWTSFQPNFFLQFAPGVIDEAPKTFLASVAKLSSEDKIALQRVLVERFSNVSIIDVSQVIERILAILNQMSWALEFMAYLALATGLVVLFSVASQQARLRRWDTALLKTLGASFQAIRSMTLIEFGLVGWLSGFFGVTGGLVLSYAFSKLVFESQWVFDWRVPLASWAAMTLLTPVVAHFASRRTLRESPILLLQSEAH